MQVWQSSYGNRFEVRPGQILFHFCCNASQNMAVKELLQESRAVARELRDAAAVVFVFIIFLCQYCCCYYYYCYYYYYYYLLNELFIKRLSTTAHRGWN